ncbi:DinB family protein [Alteribacillus sp. JSM 102045]|uniref:DinB family protein n=1 Tax=Alteribacillus sp. JSM 102045 TaxID=1562101 RepID=UPI0035C09E52
MHLLFQYNWQVRDEWFEWCKAVPEEELKRERIGGVGSFHRTLFHIVDVEISWIHALEGKEFDPSFSDYNTLEKMKHLSDSYRLELESFLLHWKDEMETKTAKAPWLKNESFNYGEVLRHVIAHEIHHIGQLSVWTRELGKTPISPNFIGRSLNPSSTG